MNRIAPNLVNAVLFQVVWFSAVLGAAQGSLAMALAALAALAWQAASAGGWKRDIGLATLCVCVGGCLDSLWIVAGILDFGTVLAPAWIVILWAAVGLSLNHSLSWFQQRPLLGGILAGGAAPFSYSGGTALGAATVVEPLGLAVVSVTWLFLFWGLFSISGTLGPQQMEFET